MRILATGAVILVMGNVADTHPSNQHSGSECYAHGHRMYVPDGLRLVAGYLAEDRNRKELKGQKRQRQGQESNF